MLLLLFCCSLVPAWYTKAVAPLLVVTVSESCHSSTCFKPCRTSGRRESAAAAMSRTAASAAASSFTACAPVCLEPCSTSLRPRNHALRLPLHSRFQPPALCLVLTVCYVCYHVLTGRMLHLGRRHGEGRSRLLLRLLPGPLLLSPMHPLPGVRDEMG